MAERNDRGNEKRPAGAPRALPFFLIFYFQDSKPEGVTRHFFSGLYFQSNEGDREEC